jgi:hypothetical protein
LRDDTRVLHNHGVACHQMWPRHASELVVRKVPRLDTEDDADRAALHMRVADSGMKFYICQEALGILGVIRQNSRAELDFAPRFADSLAHFQGHGVRQRVGLLMHELRRLCDDDGPLGIALVAPRFVAGLCRGKLGLELRVRYLIEGLDEFPVERVERLIGHGLSLLAWHIILGQVFGLALPMAVQ